MEKKTLLAVALSIGILVIYQIFFAPPPPKPAPAQKTETATEGKKPDEAKTTEAPEAVKPATAPTAEAEAKTVRVDTELYAAEFTTEGGTIKSFKLKKFTDKEGLSISLLKERGALPPLGIGSAGDYSISARNYVLTGGDLTLKAGETGTLIFDYSDGARSIKRTYTFYGDNYKFGLKDETVGLPSYELTLGTHFGIALKEESGVHTGPVVLADTDRVELTAKKLKEAKTFSGALKWVAQEDKYFFASAVPVEGQKDARAWLAPDGSEAVSLRGGAGGSYLIYAGPKEHDKLKELGVGLEHIIDFGFFSVIARPLFWFLKFLHRFVGNWGWAIVLLTIVVRIPFIPIVSKGQMAMKKLQDIQPRMQEIKEKYKKDPQKMQAEMMGLYKKHKVNPMGGCLPMLLQIPVFFALYKVLMIAIELRGAPFMLWVTDLSAKDPYYVLPIVMGATMVLQQKMTPSTGDPKQQKLMMLMPVIFTFMFLSFASGLVLYWLVNNILSIAQQFYINRKAASAKPA